MLERDRIVDREWAKEILDFIEDLSESEQYLAQLHLHLTEGLCAMRARKELDEANSKAREAAACLKEEFGIDLGYRPVFFKSAPAGVEDLVKTRAWRKGPIVRPSHADDGF